MIDDDDDGDDMWTLFQSRLPKAMLDLLTKPSNVLVAFCPSNDEHNTNKMLLAYLENIAPNNVFHFPGWCKQHGTGNCLQPLVKRLGILSPEFCLVRRLRSSGFQQRFLNGIKACIKKNLKWVKQRERPNWRPDPSDRAYAEKLLELVYYRRDVRTSEGLGGDDAANAKESKQVCAEAKRRELGAKLLDRCPCNWRQSELVVLDRGDEFATEDAVVDAVYELIVSAGFQAGIVNCCAP